MSSFHHTAAILTSALVFPNPFSCASTNLSKVLAMGFTSAVLTLGALNARWAGTRAAQSTPEVGRNPLFLLKVYTHLYTGKPGKHETALPIFEILQTYTT